MIDREFAALKQAAVESRLGEAAVWAADHLAAAWSSSKVAGVARSVRADVASWPARDRLRTAAMVLGWAAFAYWGALAVMPPYVATGIPHLWFPALGVLSFAAAAAAPSLHPAWRDSTVNRWLGWILA